MSDSFSPADFLNQPGPKPAVETHLPTLAPEADAAILRAGGFRDVDLFFAAFTWRGWIGQA